MKIQEFIESIMTPLSNGNLNYPHGIFVTEKDRFKCRTLDTKDVEFTNDTEFKTRLRESLLLWEQDGTRAVWVKVAIENSSLVPILTDLDFHFHHAQREYVMLKKWLAKNEPDNTPDYAGQYLGCAGFVVNSRGKVLVVQEKYHTKKHWKLPGGHADPGEEISEAARREVFEETGIQSEFQSVICFRHQHNYKYSCSDFYFVCLMTPVNENICKGDNEISACQWMEVQDLIDHPDTAELNRHIARCYQELSANGQFTLTPTPVPFQNNTQVQHLVYSVQPCLLEQGRTVITPQSVAGRSSRSTHVSATATTTDSSTTATHHHRHHTILDSVAAAKSSSTTNHGVKTSLKSSQESSTDSSQIAGLLAS